jgi:hypothetical protein
LEFPSLPDPYLSDVLNYNKADDEIVGCLHRYAKDNPQAHSRLLTHDTGPMMAAKSLGLSIETIRDDWLLPPENNETERENIRLKNQIVQLRKQEPQFNIKCVDNEGKEVKCLKLIANIYEPLSQDDVSKYVNMLKARFPIETEFNRREPKPTIINSLAIAFGEKYHFEPASAEAIAKYEDQEYPKWVQDCYDTLSTLHELLQQSVGQPTFEFVVANDGTRPGNDTLVVIRTKGNFKICPPPYRDQDDYSESDGLTEPSIPSPPDPPRGRWIGTRTLLDQALYGLNFGDVHRVLDSTSFPGIPYLPEKPRRDPNGFYYKPVRITEPDEEFRLECEQWRHGTDYESFNGEIFFDKESTNIAGMLECVIHAENLSEPTIKKVPVRIEVRYVNARAYANNLVNPPWDMLFRNNKPEE